MNPKPGNHRILLVLLLFLPACLIGLWLTGGNRQEFQLSVQSELSPAELEQRLDQILSSLESLSAEQLARHTRDAPEETLTAQPVKFAAPGAMLLGSDFSIPLAPMAPARGLLADIVIPQHPDSSEVDLEIDPAIIYRDAAFENRQVDRSWLGKDNSSIYLRETDDQHHLRLVRLERGQLRFEPSSQGKSKGRIIYTFSVRHEGLRRFYGKFLERECETLALSRLRWVCDQLEDCSESGMKPLPRILD